MTPHPEIVSETRRRGSVYYQLPPISAYIVAETAKRKNPAYVCLDLGGWLGLTAVGAELVGKYVSAMAGASRTSVAIPKEGDGIVSLYVAPPLVDGVVAFLVHVATHEHLVSNPWEALLASDPARTAQS